MPAAETNTLSKRGRRSPDLDAFDRKILDRLKADSRMTYADIGHYVHLSAPAVYERVRKLRASGIIKNYTVTTDPRALGLTTCAFVSLTLSELTCHDFAPLLAARPEVEECHSVAGHPDLIVKVRVGTPDDLDGFVTEMSADPAVKTISTLLVLKTYEPAATGP